LPVVSLAGVHSTAVVTTELSRAFKEDGILAYVNLIQRKERELKVDVLTHQKWSGVEYIDGILGSIKGGSIDRKSMGQDSTEVQF
jgi:isocitrate lyase